jgi:hypothetical protein
VRNSYLKDDLAQQKIQRLAIDTAEPNFSFADGLLHYQGRIWIGGNPNLQQMIISAFHDSPTGGQSGFPVTYRHLVALFKWHGMKQHIRDYVQSCYVCQLMSVSRPSLNAPCTPVFFSHCRFHQRRGRRPQWTSLTVFRLPTGITVS